MAGLFDRFGHPSKSLTDVRERPGGKVATGPTVSRNLQTTRLVSGAAFKKPDIAKVAHANNQIGERASPTA